MLYQIAADAGHNDYLMWVGFVLLGMTWVACIAWHGIVQLRYIKLWYTRLGVDILGRSASDRKANAWWFVRTENEHKNQDLMNAYFTPQEDPEIEKARKHYVRTIKLAVGSGLSMLILNIILAVMSG